MNEVLALYPQHLHGGETRPCLVALDPETRRPACALVTPTLSAMEWTRHIESVKMASEAVPKVQAIIDEPAALREAMQKRKP